MPERTGWCTITVRPTPHPTLREGRLTLEVESSFAEAFVRVLRELPWDERGWDQAAERWWVHARHREALCVAAAACYAEVYLIEGRRTTNVLTGQVSEQLGLWDEPGASESP